MLRLHFSIRIARGELQKRGNGVEGMMREEIIFHYMEGSQKKHLRVLTCGFLILADTRRAREESEIDGDIYFMYNIAHFIYYNIL
jgi:hypothetical protein